MTAPASMPVHVGAVSLKKPHHIATYTIWFSEVVNDHPPNNDAMAFLSSKMNHCAVVLSASFLFLSDCQNRFLSNWKIEKKTVKCQIRRRRRRCQTEISILLNLSDIWFLTGIALFKTNLYSLFQSKNIINSISFLMMDSNLSPASASWLNFLRRAKNRLVSLYCSCLGSF